MNMNKKKALAFGKLFLIIFILVGIPIILYLNFANTIFTKQGLLNLLVNFDSNKGILFLILVGIQALQVIICFIPGQPIQFVSSYLFGMWGGYLLSIIGAFVGAFFAFLIGRLLGAESVSIIFGEEKVENYRRKLNSGKGYYLAFLIYVIPGIPKDLVAYVAGVSEMELGPFLVLSTIGRSPGMLGSLFFGYFLKKANYLGIAIVCVVMAVIMVFCIIKRKDFAEKLDRIEAKHVEKNQ